MKTEETACRTIRRSAADGKLADTVIAAVAAASGTSPLEIEPLYRAIDPDALESLFESPPDGPDRSGGRISFSHHDCHVTIDDEDIIVRYPVA